MEDCLAFCIIYLCAFSALALPSNRGNSIGFYPVEDIFGLRPVSKSSPIKARVIGGSDAEPGTIPYQVSLQAYDFSGGRYHMCGGIIVGKFYVLTAGHCVLNKNLRNMDVVAGVNNIFLDSDTNEQRKSIEMATIHPTYNPSSFDGDLGIIRLKSPFLINNFVQPIPLAEESIEPSGKCRTSGWGNVVNNSTEPVFPGILQKADLDIVPRLKCQERYGQIVTKGMICTGVPGGGVGSCNGDSGGPLICKDEMNSDYLAGSVSWGMVPCALTGDPSVYASIPYYRDWIDEMISD